MPRETAAEASSRETANLGRLLSFARPYLGRIALTVVFSLLYAGGLTGRAYLAKTIFDDVLVPTAALRTDDLWKRVTSSGSEETRPAQDPEQVLEIERRVREQIWQLVGIGLLLVLGMPVVSLIRD